MLVKSKREDHHLDDLWETFETLCLYDMKFNPRKCVLEVSLGKFIGFKLSQRGVEANTDKIQAVLEIIPQRTSRKCRVEMGGLLFSIDSSLERWISVCHSSKC